MKYYYVEANVIDGIVLVDQSECGGLLSFNTFYNALRYQSESEVLYARVTSSQLAFLNAEYGVDGL